MKMYIFRHGSAMDRDEAIAKKISDSARALTEKGRVRSLKMAQYLYERDPDVEMILTSPFVRAQETAKIIAGVFKIQKKVIEVAELVPSAPPQALQQWLKKNVSTSTNIVIVGHEPHLTTFCSWATAGTTMAFLNLKKSGIISLELESFAEIQERSAHINWMIQPQNIL